MEKDKATVLNCRVDIIEVDKALDACKNAIDGNNNFHIITINPEMIMNAQKNSSFLNILNSSDLNIADGVGVKIALKFKGINLNHIRGVDFSRNLIALAQKCGYRVGLLGAKEEVIQKTKENFLKQHPDLNIVYSRNGYFDSDDDIIKEITENPKGTPQIFLAGLGSPKQEEFIVKLKKTTQGCVFVGVGGSFDVFSGITKESPVIFQKLGLEWLYRTVKDPKRIKRIFPALPIFLIKCIIDTVKKKG